VSAARGAGPVLTDKEEDADLVGKRSVHGLEDLSKSVMLILVVNRAACNEVGQPQGVEGREFIDLVSLLKPVLPKIEVLVVGHASHALVKKHAALEHQRPHKRICRPSSPRRRRVLSEPVQTP